MLKLKRIFSCMLAITMLLGGNIMATEAVKNTEKETKYYHKLDAQAYSGDDLGAVYTKKATTFKVWAPTASRVAVKLYATGSSEEEGAADISTTPMKKGDKGVWSVKLTGDKKNLYYTYLVTIDGVTTETADVYAKAAGVNGNRSMIVDLDSTDPKDWDKDSHVLYDDPTDAVVWEIHVRDFSKNQVSGVSDEHKGKYLAFTENGTTIDGKGDVSTCIDYLKKLGVTHVQLMPVYDYATVDESREDTEEYNWGYDPKNYNVPEGSYSTNPYDGNVRINEFKQMVKALHDAGIGVIMDVVYNHTFTAKGSWFENTVPGYYFRLKDDGSFSDGSGCGNETASEHLMYRKYMIDSVLYWANEYHIDGFRFDLMGVHDVDTMNEIRLALDTKVKNGKKIIMYGEPWTGGAVTTEATTATKDNVKLLNDRIGVFNDTFRDAVKGHVFNVKEGGFVQTASGEGTLKSCITANTLDASAGLKQSSQSVTYISAHDNYTLYDKLLMSTKNNENFNKRDEDVIALNKLSAAITLTSQGISFMQAGEEFARTKYGDENSYVSPDSINSLDWNSLVQYADLNSYYQGLIEIRKNYKPFRDPTKTSAEKIAFSDADKGVVAYTLENTLTKGKEWSDVAVVFNATDSAKDVTLTSDGGSLPEKWEIIADGTQAGLKGLGTISGNKVTVAPHSAMILADKESFDKLKLTSDKCTVNIEYKDSSGKVLQSQVIKGSEGDGFTAIRSDAFDIEYDYVNTEGKEKGKFTKEEQNITYNYSKFDGNIYELTVNYLQEGDDNFGTSERKVADASVTKVREGSGYTAVIKKVDGMKVNTDKFPANAVGIANGDITVNYYYQSAGKADLVIHYRNTDDWKKVCAYVYTSGEDGKEYNGKAPGKEMKKDSSLGDGWYTVTLKDKGNLADMKVTFSDGGKNNDPTEYSVNREVWIENGVVAHSGEVNVIYVDNSGNILETDIIKGKEGESYKTEQKQFDSLAFSSATANTEGKFSEAPAYVIYGYDNAVVTTEEETDNSSLTIVLILLGTSAATLIAAAIAGGIYSRKKKLN